jgi:hypothetical protein
MSEWDISPTLTPNSNQLNADALIGGPITVTIERVVWAKTEKGAKGAQPMTISISGGHMPWRPPLGVRRILAEAWGTDLRSWIGRSVTLFRDKSVTYGKAAAGGIRISHMTHLREPTKFLVTISRNVRVEVEIQPLVISDPLAEALREIGATIEQADAWCATVNKPPLSTADANTRAKAANHFRNNPGLLVQKAASAGESE